MKHRWRFRTARCRRLRAMVHTYRCEKCKAWDWIDNGEQAADLTYSVFIHVWECRRCGWEAWDR